MNLSDYGTSLLGAFRNADKKRDLYEIGGYPTNVDFLMSYGFYRRSGFGRAAISKINDRTWSTPPKIFDGDGTEDYDGEKANTSFERAVAMLINNHNFLQVLYELDNRQAVGRYGSIAIAAKVNDSMRDPRVPLRVNGVNNLISLKPCFEAQMEVVEDFVNDFNDVDYGNPEFYQFRPEKASNHRTNINYHYKFHRSRVITTAEGSGGDSIWGTSRLESGMNDLINLLKIGIAGAEGIFKNSRQRLHFNVVDKQMAEMFARTPDGKKNDAYRESMRNFAFGGYGADLVTSGVESHVIQASIQDPTGPHGVALQSFSSSINIPRTILTGIEIGERSSTENEKTFNNSIMSRRENYVTPYVIKRALKHLIDIGVLPEPNKGICVKWDNLNNPSLSEKMEIASKMSDVNSKARNSEPVFTTTEIREVAGYKPLEGMEFEGGEE